MFYFRSPVPSPTRTSEEENKDPKANSGNFYILEAGNSDDEDGNSSQRVFNPSKEDGWKWQDRKLKMPGGNVTVRQLVEHGGKTLKNGPMYMDNMTNADCKELKRMGYKVAILLKYASYICR